MSDPASPERASLAAALEEEEARLRRLDSECADAKARAEALRAQLAALEAPVFSARASLRARRRRVRPLRR